MSELTWRSTTAIEPQAPIIKSRTEPAATTAAEEPAATQAKEGAPTEAGLIDIASILGAPTVTVVWSTL
jgi:predicted secreted protein